MSGDRASREKPSRVPATPAAAARGAMGLPIGTVSGPNAPDPAPQGRTRRRKSNLQRFLATPSAVFGAVVVGFFLFLALFAPLLAPHDPIQGSLLRRLRPPFWMDRALAGHPLGTDQLGRDLLSQVIFGARVSLAVGIGVVLASGAVGSLAGLLAGYLRGRVDTVLSRLADWTLAFPYLILAILLMGVLGPGITNLILVLSITGWPHFFRLMRGEVLVEREKAYVEAARALGLRAWTVMLRHIARNVAHTFLVVATVRLGLAVLAEAGLSYLGFGVPPGVSAWGSLISSGQNYVETAWWLSAIPGIAILLLVLCVNLLGEGLRDALDPRMRP